jgi:hypothetical protein
VARAEAALEDGKAATALEALVRISRGQTS